MRKTAERLLEAMSLYEASFCLGKYAKSHERCAIDAAGIDGIHTVESRLIYIMMTSAWNESKQWARQVIAG